MNLREFCEEKIRISPARRETDAQFVVCVCVCLLLLRWIDVFLCCFHSLMRYFTFWYWLWVLGIDLENWIMSHTHKKNRNCVRREPSESMYLFVIDIICTHTVCACLHRILSILLSIFTEYGVFLSHLKSCEWVSVYIYIFNPMLFTLIHFERRAVVVFPIEKKNIITCNGDAFVLESL